MTLKPNTSTYIPDGISAQDTTDLFCPQHAEAHRQGIRNGEDPIPDE